ncbi:MAG: hypothetical protein IRZ15_03545 [Bryobacteraceae bacterium]|nr:hypothetical protein [Bryobacteraceae bacterium]
MKSFAPPIRPPPPPNPAPKLLAVDPRPEEPIADPEEEEEDDDDEDVELELDEDEEDELLDELENRLEAPRKLPPTDVAEPDPVLATEGDAPAADAESLVLAAEELLPLLLFPPALLTTVICRTPGPPLAMLTLIPPRLPRSRGTTRETYFSAAVTPVTRIVCSREPVDTVAVRIDALAPSAPESSFGDNCWRP